MTSLRALAARLRTRELGVAELVEATLVDLERRGPALNPFAHVPAERALAAARAADGRRAPLPSLHGVPFSVKEQIHVAGVPTRDASLLVDPLVPSMDADVVARLRKAGAILVATTNMSELALFPDTVNRVYGATRNPHDATWSAGGSSGGEAAAVAAGLVPLGFGSDYGGSIRCPAHFCGVAGLRPGPGVLPNGGATGRISALGRSRLSTVGPLSRTADDLAVVLDALGVGGAERPLARVSTVADGEPCSLEADCVAAVDAVVTALVALGLERVEETGAPAAASTVFDALTAIETRTMLQSLVPGRETDASAQLLAVWASVADVEPSPAAHAELLARLPVLQADVADWLGGDRVLVAPAASRTAFELGRIDGVFELFADCKLASVAGLPALVIPLPGSSPPCGVQLIGPRGSERALLRLGIRLERALGAG